MKVAKDSLIGFVNPKPNSTIMIYDVHASESGALAILNDLYNQIIEYNDQTIKWVFVVSTPEYAETDNVVVLRFPWVKKSWAHRMYFDNIVTRKLLKSYMPDQVFSLQNKGISFYDKRQIVYLHLPFILTDHKFSIKRDGKRLWLYQNVINKSIFKSLRTVDLTIVQTQWMKSALIEKGRVEEKKIAILQPDITSNNIGCFEDNTENRKRIFYPATAFTYKNHMTLLKALVKVQESGIYDYEAIFTIRPDENDYTKKLYSYAAENQLNVRFNGPISREQVFEMYTKSILVFPSYVESFGLPLLEARLSNTYVIASDCPFCREILTGYYRAAFFGSMDYKALAQKVIELMA